MRVLIHRPPTDAKDLPAILYIHGGGFIAGAPDMMAVASTRLATEQNAVVVAVQYRLAPETPFPGPVEDCYAALLWMATAQMARDMDGPALKAQFLLYPMLDARTGTDKAQIPAERIGHLSLAEATSLEALPATFIAIGSLDLLLEESLAYAQRLSRVNIRSSFAFSKQDG